MSERGGICPNCKKGRGEVGKLCTTPLCSAKGYHFIPVLSFQKNVERVQSSAGEEDRLPDSQIGLLIDRYLLVEKLGQGGMGAVYLALQMPLMREVAFKTISSIVLDEVAKKRFEREARAISILYHPNIVSLVDFGFNPSTGSPFMALEYIKGGRELSFEMKRKGAEGQSWDEETIVHIFSQILNGLQVAHKNGLIHRDMKPQNVMLVDVEGDPYFVKILDFGLTRALVELPDAQKLTVQGAIMGTPQYMAPEQIAGGEQVDHRCDLYAVGAILFEMVVGKPICEGDSSREIFFKKMSPDFDPFKDVELGHLPDSVVFFLKKAINSAPARRFSSAYEMRQALVSAFLPQRVTTAVGTKQELGYAPTVEMELPFDKRISARIVATPTTAPRSATASPRPSGAPEPQNQIHELEIVDVDRPKSHKVVIVITLLGILAASFAFVFFGLKGFRAKEWPGSGQAGLSSAGGAPATGAQVREVAGGAGQLDATRHLEYVENVEDMLGEAPVGKARGRGRAIKRRTKRQASVRSLDAGIRGEVTDVASSLRGVDVIGDLKVIEEDVSAGESGSFGRIRIIEEESEGKVEERQSEQKLKSTKVFDEVVKIAMKKAGIRKLILLCAGGRKGRVVMKITISAITGKVAEAEIIAGPFQATAEGRCMQEAVRSSLKFAPGLFDQNYTMIRSFFVK